MERLVEMKIAKFNILSIIDCYYRLFPLIYISYDSEGITIQGSCKERKILATLTTVIPRESFDHYECKEPLVIAVPLHLRKLGGRCVGIDVLQMTAGELRNNGVSYEAISSYMYKLSDHPKITKGISFESYPSTKKFLSCIEDPSGEVEVEVNWGVGPLRAPLHVATFKVDIFRISKFIVGFPGEHYCKIPIKSLKLLNKFLVAAINNSKTEFCKREENLLFLVDKEHCRIDIQLTPIIKL